MSTKLLFLKQKFKDDKVRLITLIALLILIPILIGSITVLQVNKIEDVENIAESKYLYITDYRLSEPKTLKFEFSDPVDIQQLVQHFSISPEIEGKLQKDGLSNKKFKFVADENLPENSHFTISILSGLASTNRKPFLEDFSMTFSNTANSDSFLKKNGISGRVMSFDAGKPIEVEVANTSPNSVLNIYKSDNASLLNFLAYEPSKDKSYYYNYGKFLRNTIPHDKNKIVLTKNLETSAQKFSLDPGVYYLEGTVGEDDVYGAGFIVVSKNGVILRQDDQKLVLANFSLTGGDRQNLNSEAIFYNLEKAPTRIGESSYSEIERGFNIPFSQPVDAALVTIGNESVFVPIRLPQSLAEINAFRDLEKTYNIFVYTDRPIYKPGDTVFFRGIVRMDADSLYKMPSSGTPVYISTGISKKNEKPDKITVLTDSKGVFSGNFVIPTDTKPTGEYGLEALNASLTSNSEDYLNRGSYAYYEIDKYIKPEFEIKVEAENPESLRHENPKFVITGKYFSGKPMANQEVEYSAFTTDYYESEKMVYNKNFNISSFGGMCGGGSGFGDDYYGIPVGDSKKIKLDESGKAIVEFPADTKALLSQSITITAKKSDKSGNEISGAATSIRHAGAFNLFIIPSSYTFKAGDSVSVPFYTEELNGEKVANKDFKYKLIENIYSSGKTSEKELLSGISKSDENGKGIVAITLPSDISPNSYNYLIIEGTDRYGNTVENRKTIYVSDKTSVAYYDRWADSYDTFLKISSTQNSYQLGQNINLNVNSPVDLDVLLTFERGRIYNPQVLHLQKGDNKVSIPVTVEHSPSITPVFSFFNNGIYYSEGLSLNIPSMHKLLNISITSNKDAYKKGENAEMKIRVKDASGNPVAAQLSLGIVDKAIYALRKSATPAVHSSFYYFRPRTTNASSSLTWVGTYADGRGGGGGGGGTNLSQLVDTLYWNPNIQADSNGEVTLSVPLGETETIWKALVIGSDESTDVGQADMEFLVN